MNLTIRSMCIVYRMNFVSCLHAFIVCRILTHLKCVIIAPIQIRFQGKKSQILSIERIVIVARVRSCHKNRDECTSAVGNQINKPIHTHVSILFISLVLFYFLFFNSTKA